MTLVVSPLARVRRVDGRVEISARTTLSTSDSEILAVLHAFATPRTVRSVQCALLALDVLEVVAEPRLAGVLVSLSEIDSLAREGDSLAFHRRSRTARVDGGKAPFSPPVAPARSGTVIPLSSGAASDQDSDVADFRTVLEARRSRRSWGPGPVRDLGRFLWLSARNRSSGSDVVSRPYPSGGAAHSLELYPAVAPGAVVGVPAGVYRYLPDVHALELVSADGYEQVIVAASASASAERAPITIVVTSRFERVASSYRELAYSLVLKGVGGLFQTMYLVAEHLGLALCTLGGGCPDNLFSTLIGSDDQVEPVVGEMLLGPR